jgi:hypothetical protein
MKDAPPLFFYRVIMIDFDPKNARIIRNASHVPYEEPTQKERRLAKEATKLANAFLTQHGFEARIVLYPIRKRDNEHVVSDTSL